MGATSSSTQGQVLPSQPQGPPQPPYPGPVVENIFINTEVRMQANITFSMSSNMITTDIDSYYPILGQKYAEGFRLLTFYRIPGASKRTGGLFSAAVKIPFQAIFCRYPQVPSPVGLQLRIVKSVMVAQTMRHGLITVNPQVVGDTSHISQAILEHTRTGGRLICVEMTGQQQGQGFGAAMHGVSPIMGVDLFFETPTTPTNEVYVYQSLACPVTIQTQMSFTTSVVCHCDWNGMLGSQLSYGWKLVEIFFDMGAHRHGAFSTSASLNSIWFFEKPASRIQDNTPIYQGTVITHYIQLSAGFSGAHVTTNWEPIIQQMGAQGWEFACFVETPETRQSGFGQAEMKILLFFQRPILPPVGAHHMPPAPAHPAHGYPGGPPPYPGGPATPHGGPAAPPIGFHPPSTGEKL